MSARRRRTEAEVLERFQADTAEHTMQVQHDDGVYRHIRFGKGNSSSYYYDLVTWPGHLAIAGDMGAWLFARTTDMFTFFGGPGINPHYWSEKLQTEGRRRSAMTYSTDVYRQLIEEWYEQRAEELDADERTALRAAINTELLDEYGDWQHDEGEAHRALRDFRHGDISIHDSWEWTLLDYDYGYLWCCWAIVHGIKQYRDAQPEAVPVP